MDARWLCVKLYIAVHIIALVDGISMTNPLSNKKLYYLIGLDNASGVVAPAGSIVEVGYDSPKPIKSSNIIAVKYCNLFDEKNTGKLGPYLDDTDTAEQYGEGVIDPKGNGWWNNIGNQLAVAMRENYEYVEWDNPDAYSVKDILQVYSRCSEIHIKCLAKNPLSMNENPVPTIQHPNVYGCIVEWDNEIDTVTGMRALLNLANRQLPVWFVNFGKKGKQQARAITFKIDVEDDFHSCYASKGEYENCIQV